jgi:hypothetical protein
MTIGKLWLNYQRIDPYPLAMDINNLVDEFIQERFENVSLEQFASPKK